MADSGSAVRGRRSPPPTIADGEWRWYSSADACENPSMPISSSGRYAAGAVVEHDVALAGDLTDAAVVRHRSTSFASDDFGYLVDLGLPQMAGHNSLFALDPEIKREVVFVGRVMRTGSTLVRRTSRLRRGQRGIRARLRRVDAVAAPLPQRARRIRPSGRTSGIGRGPAPVAQLAVLRRLPGGRDRARRDSPMSAPAHRCSSDDGADLAAAIQTIIEAGFDDLHRAVADAFDGATCRWPCTTGLFDLQLRAAGHAAAAARRRILRRHTAFPAVGGRPAEPAAAVADGAQRTGDLAAPRPGAAVGVTDPGGGAVRRRSSSSPIRGRCWSFWAPCPSRRRGRRRARSRLHKDLGETRIEGLGMLTTPPWDWGKR